MGSSDPPPTRVRYGVMIYLCTLAFILYIDRVCISQAGTAMKAELNLTNTQWGMVGGAFMIAYAVFEIITGHWGDRYGSRRVLTRIVLWWSLFTALTGCVWWFEPIGFGPRQLVLPDAVVRTQAIAAANAVSVAAQASGTGLVTVAQAVAVAQPPETGGPPPGSYYTPAFVLFSSFYLLLIVRFLFGAGEAGALPNAARVIARWFPEGRRGPPQALISMSAQIGGAVAPPVAAFFIQAPYIGWRWSFVIFGCLGVVWAWFFSRWFRDDPATHPGVNEAERNYILGGQATRNAEASETSRHHSNVPWPLVFRSANIWLLGTIGACTSFYSYMLFMWFPTYLKEGRGLGELESGQLASLPFLFGAAGVMLGGYLGDWFTAWLRSRRIALGALGFVGLLFGGVLVAASVLASSPLVAALLCAVGFFCSYVQLAAWWAAMGDVGGRHLGALFGLCNMMGLAGGFVSQVFLGLFADYMKGQGLTGRAQWDPAFYLYGGILVVGGLLWLFINPRRPVVPEDAAQ
jgi:sugar phosphate permease